MKKDATTTKVLFLMEKPEGNLPCNVFAFFPEERYNTIENGTFTCYAHIGQHSACHIDYAKQCEKATPEQYADLKKELESIGYVLEVLNTPEPAPKKIKIGDSIYAKWFEAYKEGNKIFSQTVELCIKTMDENKELRKVLDEAYNLIWSHTPQIKKAGTNPNDVLNKAKDLLNRLNK